MLESAVSWPDNSLSRPTGVGEEVHFPKRDTLEILQEGQPQKLVIQSYVDSGVLSPARRHLCVPLSFVLKLKMSSHT